MTVDWRRLLGGAPADRRRHWLVFVGGFAAVVVAWAGLAVVLGEFEATAAAFELLYERGFLVALLAGPAVVSAASAFRRGGLPASLAVGVVPSLSWAGVVLARDALWALLGRPPVVGDAPLWALVLAFGSVGVASALAGFVLGTALAVVADGSVPGR